MKSTKFKEIDGKKLEKISGGGIKDYFKGIIDGVVDVFKQKK